MGSDGTLDGQWALVGQDRTGTEQAIPLSEGDQEDLSGRYQVSGRNMVNNPYDGVLEITQLGSVYQFAWDAGGVYQGLGIRQGDWVSVGWGTDPNEQCGVISFQRQEDGRLNGTWSVFGQDQVGSQVAILR